MLKRSRATTWPLMSEFEIHEQERGHELDGEQEQSRR
jgi:hypothetical protein